MIKMRLLFMLFSFCVLGFTGCSIYEKVSQPIVLKDISVGRLMDVPIATQIQITPPTLASNRIHFQNTASPLKGADVDKNIIENSFMAVLSQSFQRSNLYEGVNINLAGDGHKLHTKISIGSVTASSPTVTARKSNHVEVEYSVTTSSGRIIAKGTVEEDGISDAGTFWTTTLTSEMTQWFMMAVEDAMSKAAVQIPAQLAKNKQFLELAMADTTPNRPNTFKNVQNHLSNRLTETVVTEHEKLTPTEQSISSLSRNLAVAKKERLAVLDLEPKYGVEKDFAEAISVIVRDEIHSHGIFEVMSSEDIRAVASRETLLQAMGCDEDGSCLLDFGRLIGTRFMVAGSIAKIGTTYTLSLRMLDTKGENVGLVNRVSEQCNCDENQVIKSVKNVAAEIMGKQPVPNYQ